MVTFHISLVIQYKTKTTHNCEICTLKFTCRLLAVWYLIPGKYVNFNFGTFKSVEHSRVFITCCIRRVRYIINFQRFQNFSRMVKICLPIMWKFQTREIRFMKIYYIFQPFSVLKNQQIEMFYKNFFKSEVYWILCYNDQRVLKGILLHHSEHMPFFLHRIQQFITAYYIKLFIYEVISVLSISSFQKLYVALSHNVIRTFLHFSTELWGSSVPLWFWNQCSTFCWWLVFL